MVNVFQRNYYRLFNVDVVASRGLARDAPYFGRGTFVDADLTAEAAWRGAERKWGIAMRKESVIAMLESFAEEDGQVESADLLTFSEVAFSQDEHYTYCI